MNLNRIYPLALCTILLACAMPPAAYAAGQVPARKDIAAQHQWRLQDIYADEALWQKDFEQLQQLTAQVLACKGKLQSPKILLQCLKARDKLNMTSEKLYMYAKMHGDEDTSVAKYQAMAGNVENLLVQTGAAISFIKPELLSMPDGALRRMQQKNPELNTYRFYLENLLRQKQHVLSSAEETLLAKSNAALAAPANVFTLLSNADMKFPRTVNDAGKEIQLTEGRYASLIRSNDRTVRKQAFRRLFTTYGELRNTFAAALNGSMKGDAFYSDARRYPSSLAAALDSDNIPPEVYTNLISTVHRNLAPLHRYIALKKKALALPELHMYDLYAPLAVTPYMTYTYDEGLKLAAKGLHPLGKEYVDTLIAGARSGWVDIYENQGKRTGAYSWGPYGVHPFVLLNYDNTYDSVSTLAHEMGHAMHSYYSKKTQPYATADYPIFCAEVASTINEVLLLDYMLQQPLGKDQRTHLLSQYLEQVRATVYRQTLFAEFEMIAHGKVDRGETLTADQLGAIWHDLNVKYYGPDIVVDSEIDVEWARIPHFYTPFYVYQYVTGYSAATALADKLSSNSPDAQKHYIEFLKSGGSNYPIALLKQAGVDMSSPEPIETTLKKFEDRLAELEQLLVTPS